MAEFASNMAPSKRGKSAASWDATTFTKMAEFASDTVPG
eukprot:CAMPEP_0202001978 /NCGR_PEP_ID=MMETSP0905-20130828/7951_1 /ASSEMBLY_ACC=CAM_ASM_000554 /TAXON_ID=420261 /ORGANISM="Thalassiosira antarctica, Strain CCMP982" /LENGTH=38 /DNA_ID= /DNA_START= /DNA_END= /DNA_ORIENTATION=